MTLAPYRRRAFRRKVCTSTVLRRAFDRAARRKPPVVAADAGPDFPGKLFEFLQGLGHVAEAFVHQCENGSWIKLPFAVSLPCRRTCEELDALLHLGDRPDVKFARGHGLQNIFAQHQIFHIGLRHHHALRSGEPLDAAHVEETFDFFIHPTNGLNVALLVDRTGYRDVLAQRQAHRSPWSWRCRRPLPSTIARSKCWPPARAACPAQTCFASNRR